MGESVYVFLLGVCGKLWAVVVLSKDGKSGRRLLYSIGRGGENNVDFLGPRTKGVVVTRLGGGGEVALPRLTAKGLCVCQVADVTGWNVSDGVDVPNKEKVPGLAQCLVKSACLADAARSCVGRLWAGT